MPWFQQCFGTILKDHASRILALHVQEGLRVLFGASTVKGEMLALGIRSTWKGVLGQQVTL